jgi:MoaA/NifB/PqqE/SkfB family radical SAM enzyme
LTRTNYKLGFRDVFFKGLNFWRKPDPAAVLWLNFAVTYRCNGRCAMCNIWQKYPDNPDLSGQELNLKEIASLLRSKYLTNLQGVSFTGGEPFLRKDFVALVGLFVQRYPQAFVGIASNGLNPDLTAGQTLEIIKRYNPKYLSLSLSLDGIGGKHDEMRGVAGAYHRVMETVKRLQKGTGVNLGFDFTITPQNYQALPQVAEISRRLGVKLLAGLAHNSQSYYGNQEMSFAWQPEELAALRPIMEKMVKQKIRDEKLLARIFDPYAYFMQNTLRYEVKKQRLFRCYSGTHSLFLDPQGDIYPCIVNGERMGNIREKGFDALWFSPAADLIRRQIAAKKCHCWVACEVTPSLFRSPGIVGWNLRHKFPVNQ